MEKSPGRILADARKEKHLTLSQVYQDLRIKERYLLALEEDRLDDLPSTIHANGFLRMYREYLGLPPELMEDSPGEPGQNIQDNSTTGPEVSTSLPDSVRSGQVSAGAIAPEVQPAEKSADLLVAIGTELRSQRQKLHLTLESIEAVTHIPSFYIRSLEEGRLEKLPSPVQARGMLNNYAGFLDLDVETLLLKFADAIQLRRSELAPVESGNKKKRNFRLPARKNINLPVSPSIRNYLSLDILIIISVALIAVISLIWGASSIVSSQLDPKATETASAAMEAIKQTATAQVAISPTILLSVTTLEQAETRVVESGSTATIIAPTTSGSPIQVFVVARQRAFMKVTVDGKVVFSGRVTAGNPYYFNGKSGIELVTGNAAALQVIYNQFDLGALGAQGEVIHLIFAENAFGTPTPTASTTPTATQRASRTPVPSNTYAPTRTKTSTPSPLPTRTASPTRTPWSAFTPTP